MRVRDLMMHMSGLGYALDNSDITVDMLRRPPGERLGKGATLETLVDRLAEAPLRFHPGTHWLYSLSTDVCARLVEVLSGQRFDDYLRTTIFEPLGMVDTGFSRARRARRPLRRQLHARRRTSGWCCSTIRSRAGTGGRCRSCRAAAAWSGPSADYLRFCLMLLGGGELDGVRILGRKTVELMAANHLPGGGELSTFALPGAYGEVGFAGMGFGLTVAVSLGPVATGVVGSPGEYMWGGAASTLFWIDPVEDLVVVFMTQLIPSGTFNFRGQLKTLVYPAIVD